MARNSYGVEIDQRCINFIQMLEREYKTDIKTSADFVAIRNIWINEGSTMPKRKNVRQKGCERLREPIYQKIPMGIPIRWEDQ